MSIDLYAAGHRRKDECATHTDQRQPMRGYQGKFIDISDFVARWGVFNEKSERRWNASNTKVLSNGNVEASTDCVRWAKGTNDGNHPCKDFGESTLILDSDDFDDSDFGFKCSVRNSDVVTLLNKFKNTPQLNGPGVTDSGGVRKNFYDQILFGVSTKSGKAAGGKGFCSDIANIDAVVGPNDETCFEEIQKKWNAEAADELGYEYCRANRNDERCSCLNVTGVGWIERCRDNPDYAGCSEINKRMKEIETLLCPLNPDDCPSVAMYGANPDCLAPGICSGTQVNSDPDKKTFRPRIPLEACSTKLSVCNQLIQADDIEAVGKLDINQTCEIDTVGLAADRKAMRAAIKAAREAQLLWEQQQYELQLRRDQKMVEDDEEAERIRNEMRADQKLDREADRELSAQMVAHRSLNVEKRRAEREAREDKLRADDAQRKFLMESSKIGGYDAKTITFVVSVIFSAIFALIVAFRV
jgi:hypothetical protein